MTRSQEWQIAGWSLFALAFAVAGAVPIGTIGRQPQVADQAPLNSTDAVFLRALGLRDGTARIRELLETLPRDRAVAIVYRDDPSLVPAAAQVSVLCWPRPAPWLRVERGANLDLAGEIFAHQSSAAFFFGIDPPPTLSAGTVLAPELRFVRTE